jgi:hypothetical protein
MNNNNLNNHINQLGGIEDTVKSKNYIIKY